MPDEIQHIWSLQDTFNQWLVKYNQSQEVIKQINDSLEDLGYEFVKSEFTYSPETGDSLVVEILDGKVRYGESVEFLDAKDITLLPNTTSVVGIFREEDALTSSLEAFTADEIPDQQFVPLYSFVTNATTVTDYEDLRTRFSFGSGGGNGGIDGAIIQIEKLIQKDIIVKPGRNAISVSPTVGEGFTVTVSEGSDWVIL